MLVIVEDLLGFYEELEDVQGWSIHISFLASSNPQNPKTPKMGQYVDAAKIFNLIILPLYFSI